MRSIQGILSKFYDKGYGSFQFIITGKLLVPLSQPFPVKNYF